MAVGTDPRYRALAVAAADELGANPAHDLLVAITAQWQCEQPANRWPPVHNNPGNVTSGAMHSVGEPAAAATSSPGIGFLAQYSTPEDGARAYGRLLAKGSRYSKTQAAAIAGNGALFLKDITAAGYGTRYSCAIGAYNRNGGVNVGGTLPSTGGGGSSSGGSTGGSSSSGGSTGGAGIPDAVLASFTTDPGLLNEFLTSIGRLPADPIRDGDVVPFVRFMQSKGLVPGGDPGNPLVAAVVTAVRSHVGQAWSSLGASLQADAGSEDPFGLKALFGALPGALGRLMFLGAFLVLILLGLYVVASSEG